jgi:hypothetical protein
MSTLTKPRAKKPARKAAPAARVTSPRKASAVRNLPKGAIKLGERDYALDALAGPDLSPEDV